MKPSARKKHRNAIQKHHITYNPERIVKIYQKEHFVLTVLNRLNPVSKGLFASLRYFVKMNKHRGIKL